MRKLLGLALGAALLTSGIVACSGGETVAPAPSTALPAPEDPLDPPGTIPAECQALLQKSQDWGYRPGQKWKPSSPEQALEVLRFFGDFHLVPEKTSTFYRAFLNGALPADEAAAAAVEERIGRAQLCDSVLAQGFLEALIAYPWSAAARPEAQTELFQFVLNQQARVMPFVPRMIALEVHRHALAKKLSRGNPGDIAKLLKEGETFRVKTAVAPANTSLERVRGIRQELEFSERVRESLSRSLPLP